MKKPKPDRPGSAGGPPARAAKTVTLAELTALCQEWHDLRVVIPDAVTGQPRHDITFKVRRLTPAEDVRVQLILAEAMPRLEPKKDAEGKPVPGQAEASLADLATPEYLAASSRQQRLARALVCYLAAPIFHEDPHGATLREAPLAELADWVQRQAHEVVLDEIYRVAASQPITAAQAEVFTRAAASRRS